MMPVYAERNGLPAPLVDGQMLGAFLAEMVQDWAGPRGFLLKLSFQNRGMVFAGDSITCHGLCGIHVQAGRAQSGGVPVVD